MIGDEASTLELGLERVSTGIPGLDGILGGGFPRGSINVVMGHPGTGKTVLAQQIVFHNAGGDRPILYLTTLSEPLAKVVTYLQGFSFYDESSLLEGIVYEDLRADLTRDGSQALLRRIHSAIRELGPKIVVVDSFRAVHDLAGTAEEMRRLVSELTGILTAYDATVFLVGEYDEGDIPEFPEFAVADGIIQIARKASTQRDDRFVRVLKLRGSTYAEGSHSFRITPDGLHVHPRLVTSPVPRAFATVRERVSTGVPGLDELMGGGFWRGSTALVTGQAGSGKTTLALQFAAGGVRSGEPALFLNFQENPTQLARTVDALGLSVEDLKARGLHFQYASPVELSIDRIVVDLLETVRAAGVRRVAIDAMRDLLVAADDRQRFREYLYALCQELIVEGVTALLTLEAGPGDAGAPLDDGARFASMVDALVELDIRMKPTPVRTLRVVKARGISHDMRYHEMLIETGGVRVGDPLEGS